MAEKANTEWVVLPHGPLEPLAENLWRVQGSLKGMTLKRNMTVVRLEDGSLLLHSGIALDEAGMKALEALGKPSVLVIPNPGHRLDAPAFKRRYPGLRIYTPVGARKAVEEVVAVDGTYEDFPENPVVHFDALPGVKGATEGAMWVHSKDGVSLVLNDTVMNMDRKKDVLGWFFTTLIGSAPGPRVSRMAKWMWIDDQAALKADLEKRAERQDLVRLIVSHDKVASGAEAKAALRQAASFLA